MYVNQGQCGHKAECPQANKVIDMAPHVFWPRQQQVGTINMEMFRRDWRDGKLLVELRVIGDASGEPEHAVGLDLMPTEPTLDF